MICCKSSYLNYGFGVLYKNNKKILAEMVIDAKSSKVYNGFSKYLKFLLHFMEDFMKKIRRILSFIVAMAMIMSMSTLCFLVTAEDDTSTSETQNVGFWKFDKTFSIGNVGDATVLESGCLGIMQHDNYDGNDPRPLGTTVVEGSDGVASIVASNNKRAFSKSSTGIIDINPAAGTSSIVYFKAPVDGTYYYDIDLASAWAEGAAVANWTEFGVRESLTIAHGFDGNLGYAGGVGLGTTGGDFTHSQKTFTGSFTIKAGQYLVLKLNAQGSTDNNPVTLKRFVVYMQSENKLTYNVDNPAKVNGDYTFAGTQPGTGEYDELEDAARNPSWNDSGEWLTWHGKLNSEYTYFCKSQYGGIVDANPKPHSASYIIYTAPTAGTYSFGGVFYKGTSSPTEIVVAPNGDFADSTIDTESSSTAGTTLYLGGEAELAAGDKLFFRISTTGAADSTEVAVKFLSVVNTSGHNECTNWNDDGTCKTGATCVVCGENTGATNAENHELDTFTYENNNDGATHTKKYECCTVTADAAEAHDFENGNVCVCGAVNANAPYRAGLSATTPINKNDTAKVTVNVSGEAGKYASGEIVVTYVNTIFTFDKDNSILPEGTTVDTSTAGKIILVITGEDKTFGTDDAKIELAFTATATSEGSKFVLQSAGFSLRADAKSEDLAAAIIETAEVSVVVNEQVFNVDLGEGLSADYTEVVAGTDFNFKYTGAYKYYTITAKVGSEDGDTVPVVAGENAGEWKVLGANVTGDLYITVALDAKEFGVTINGEATGNANAYYMTDYTFVIDDNTYVDDVTNYFEYTLGTITIGGVEYNGVTNPSGDGKTYVIPGADITGDIEITIDEEEITAGSVKVTVTDEEGIVEAAGTASKTENFSFTVGAGSDPLYDYVVYYKIGDADTVEAGKGAGTYTIAKEEISGPIAISIVKVLKTAVSVVEDAYLTIEDENDVATYMWLVLNNMPKLDDGVYYIDGNAMFWSDNYQAYCYLVIAENAPEPASFTITIGDGTVVDVDYGKNVNMSVNGIDANDAQFVWNMYNKDYKSFDEANGGASMEKFLRADLNNDKQVDTGDATVIITACVEKYTANN